MKYDAPYTNDENIPEREPSDDYMPDRTELEPMRCSVFNKQCDTCQYCILNNNCKDKDCRDCSNSDDCWCNCVQYPEEGEMSCKFYKEYKQDDNDND